MRVKFGKFVNNYFQNDKSHTDGSTVTADILADGVKVGTIEGEYTTAGSYDGKVRMGEYTVTLDEVPEDAEDIECFTCVQRSYRHGDRRVASPAEAKKAAKLWVAEQLS